MLPARIWELCVPVPSTFSAFCSKRWTFHRPRWAIDPHSNQQGSGEPPAQIIVRHAHVYKIIWHIIKQHFYVCDKFTWICQNGPLDKFMQFLYMRSSVLCIAMYGARKKFMQYKFMRPVLDSHNSHQYSCSHVYINLTHKFVTLGYVKIMVSCGKGSSYVQLMQ